MTVQTQFLTPTEIGRELKKLTGKKISAIKVNKLLQEMIQRVTDLANNVNDQFENIIKNSIRESEIFDEPDCVNIYWKYKQAHRDVISIYLELRVNSWTLKCLGGDKILGFQELKGKDYSYLLPLINEKLGILNELEREAKEKEKKYKKQN